MAIYQYRLELISHKGGHASSELGGAYNSIEDALGQLWQALGYHMRRDDMPIIYGAAIERVCEKCEGLGSIGKRVIKTCPSCKGKGLFVEQTIISLPIETIRHILAATWWYGEGQRPAA